MSWDWDFIIIDYDSGMGIIVVGGTEYEYELEGNSRLFVGGEHAGVPTIIRGEHKNIDGYEDLIDKDRDKDFDTDEAYVGRLTYDDGHTWEFGISEKDIDPSYDNY